MRRYMDYGKEIGARINELLAEKGMTKAELAEKSGLPYKRIWRLCSCMYGNPGIFFVRALCKGFGITVDEFLASELFDREEE